jgi:hypothetical protein
LRPFSYGWGTWIDRWEKIDWSFDYLNAFLNNPEQISAFNRGGEDFTTMLISQIENKIDSWAIRFCFALLFQPMNIPFYRAFLISTYRL